ncbi:hypothetical protein CRENBAI_018195 [Crenichthys baileyi]|uniref:Uncharacterized protein n=1 Tax=Crenichthys baileyi TaxID=28760 RepID=A0AAV9SNZ5_9TELE
MTPSCVSAPTNQRQVCIPPQPITLKGFAFKDLQPWISLLSHRASMFIASCPYDKLADSSHCSRRILALLSFFPASKVFAQPPTLVIFTAFSAQSRVKQRHLLVISCDKCSGYSDLVASKWEKSTKALAYRAAHFGGASDSGPPFGLFPALAV